jgi:DNA-binding beta-propeller fold protein YncE
MIFEAPLPFDTGIGGIAVNYDGTLFASVDKFRDCVYIYSLREPTAAPVVFGAAGTDGNEDQELCNPTLACFVRRCGEDTLLVCDSGKDRVVEITASGLFLRALAVGSDTYPFGVAYCALRDVIAVSLNDAHAVVQLQYESGAVKPEATIGFLRTFFGSPFYRSEGDGELDSPMGVAFTADGQHVLVVDVGNERVSKFSSVSGAFVAHVANGISSLGRDIVQCEDGIVIIQQGGDGEDSSPGLVYVTDDGATAKNIIIPCASGGVFSPMALSYSFLLNGVVVKTVEGKAFGLRDAWTASSRCAWLSALSLR